MNKKLLIKFAEFIYRPAALKPVPGWYVGMIENENKLSYYRKRLQKIWFELMNDQDFANTILKIKWWHGIKLALHLKTELSRCIYIEGVYEPNEFYFLDHCIKPGMTFIDIGANNGWFGLFAAKKIKNSGSVFIIEPSQREIDKIERNIRLNRFKNIKVFKMGMLNELGEKELLVAEDKYEGHNTFGDFKYKIDFKLRENVEIGTLDNFIKNEKINRVDVIKIDAEGSEMLILDGGKNTIKIFRPIILSEVSKHPLTKCGNDIFSFLKNLSYDLYTFNQNNGLLNLIEDINDRNCENIIMLPKEKALNFLI